MKRTNQEFKLTHVENIPKLKFDEMKNVFYVCLRKKLRQTSMFKNTWGYELKLKWPPTYLTLLISTLD